MPEKKPETVGEQQTESQTFDRRSYLKLASVAGAGLGAGALNAEFTTLARAADTVVDDFSDTDLDGRYAFQQRDATTGVTTISSPVTSEADANILQMDGGGSTVMHAFEGDGDTDLNAYPEPGDTFSCWVRGLNGTEVMNFNYGAQDANNKYYVQFNLESAHLGLFKYVDGSGQSLVGDWSNSTIQNNTDWFKVEIQWTTDHQHTVTLYQDGSEVTSFSYTEDNGDPQFTANGVGFSGHLNSGETAQFDYSTTTGDGDGGSNNGSVYKQSNIDNFEVADKELDAYRFDRGGSGAEIIADEEQSEKDSFGPTYSGTRALKISGSTATEMISLPGDGLESYPEAGDTIECYVKAEGGADNLNFSWGVQGHQDRYYAKLEPESGSMYIFKYKNGEGDVLGSTHDLTMSQDTWYYLEVKWETDGTHTVELYDVAGNVLSECSGVDSEWTSGGVGFDAYLNSGEAVYFDDCVIVHEEGPYKGGWGPNHLVSYHSESTNYAADGDWNQVDDFHFFLNYDGAQELLNDDGSTDQIVHVFHAGAIFQTYNKEATFRTDPRQQDLAPEAIQGGTKIHGFVTGSQSTTSITSMNDEHTWAFAADRTEWSNWKDNDSNWDNQDRFDEFKRNAIETGPLDENDSDSVAKVLYFAFNSAIALTAPSGVAIAISTIDLLGDLAFNPDSNCTGGNPNTDGGEPDVEWVEWDWCDPMTLSVSMRSFEVKVEPETGHSDVSIRHGVLPADNFSADNACQWSIRCPASVENATWTAQTYSGDIPPEFNP